MNFSRVFLKSQCDEEEEERECEEDESGEDSEVEENEPENACGALRGNRGVRGGSRRA